LIADLRSATIAIFCAVGAGAVTLIGATAWLFISAWRHQDDGRTPGLDMLTFAKHVSIPVAIVTFVIAPLVLMRNRSNG
jgi:hypothetical protein